MVPPAKARTKNRDSETGAPRLDVRRRLKSQAASGRSGLVLALVAALALAATPGLAEPQPPAKAAQGSKAKPDAMPTSPPATCAIKPEDAAKEGPARAECFPEPALVSEMCSTISPTAAVRLFHKSSPFTHVYLRAKTRTWSTGKKSVRGGDWLERNEEVVLVGQRDGGAAGGMVSYLALRFDGSCVFLTPSEVTSSAPLHPKLNPLQGNRLDNALKRALRRDPKVDTAFRERYKACFGVLSTDKSPECEKGDQRLSVAIGDYLRRGGEIPTFAVDLAGGGRANDKELRAALTR